MSGSATTTATTDASDTDPPPPADSSSGEPPPETDTGECPFGTEGCQCDVGAACDEGLSCNGDGFCVAPVCRPIDTDPHADEDSAEDLPNLNCGGNSDLGVIATLEGPETDWYTYRGNEGFMCTERPGAVVGTDVTTEVCVFIECLDGNAQNIQCANGAVAFDSPDGRHGCCGVGEARIGNYSCSGLGSSKDVDVWISVGTDETTCSDYSLSYLM